MKKIIYLIAILGLICAFTTSATNTGVIFSDNKVRISIEQYNPHPVAPGEYFDLWLKVQAVYSSTTDFTLNDFKIEVIEDYPFILDTSEDSIKEFGNLKEGQQVVFKYRVRVAEDAVEGVNPIRFKYHTGLWSSQKSPPLDIEIATRDTALVIKEFKTEPEDLSAGAEGTIKLTLENPTDSLMRNINIKLNLFSLPITALNSIAEKHIYSLSSGKETELAFNVIVDPDAESKVYKLPVELRYADRAGSSYSLNNSIALLVKTQPDYQIDIIDTDIYTSSSRGRVTLGLSNKGTSEIKFVSMEIQPSDDYEVLSPSRVYIGNIESDDFDTAEFDMFIKKSWEKEVPIKVLLSYKDAFNQELNKYIDVNLPLYSGSEAVKYGLVTKSNFLSNLIILLIMIIVGWIFYKQYRKTKSFSQAAKNTYHKIYEFLKSIWRKLISLPKKLTRKLRKKK